ncbi:MAG TPA: Os1348 family NHLP clan protein [Chloroflexota bacterium]
MSADAMGQIMDRYTSDPAFRDEMRSDPEGTIQRNGWQLDEEERAALQGIDWNLPDEQLKARIGKVTGWGF